MSQKIYYGFRLTDNKFFTPVAIAKWFTKYCDRIAYCRETGKEGHLHYHYYLELKKENFNTIRTYIKTKFEKKDPKGRLRGFTTLKLADDDTKYVRSYVRYMCKPDPVKDINNPIEYRLNFPEEWMKQGIEDEKKYQQELEEKKKKKKQEEKGQFKTIVELLDEFIKKNKIDIKHDAVLCTIQKGLCNEILKYFTIKEKKLTKHSVESILTTYLCMRSPQYLYQMSDSIVEHMNFKRI